MADKNTPEQNDFKPKGTIVILLIFLLTIIVLWGSVYLILLKETVYDTQTKGSFSNRFYK